MGSHIIDVIDGARYVEKIHEFGFAVWHGGHTVNFYAHDMSQLPEVTATHTISVGDFETGEVTLEDVKDGIEAQEETPQI